MITQSEAAADPKNRTRSEQKTTVFPKRQSKWAAGYGEPSFPPPPSHYPANDPRVRERERRRGALLAGRRLRLWPSPSSFASAERRAE